jgi:beta-lactamase class D
MKMDRRTFARGLALGAGAGILGFPEICGAADGPIMRATLVVDPTDGRVLHRSGACETRYSPCSTFKIPLALMGFDAGILRDAHHPAWDFDPRIHQANRATDRLRTDPTSWEANSVVWYSQQLTRRLGEARFKAYVDRFGYGNRDVSGNPGKHDGLTQAWLLSSLKISVDEQVAFLRRMLAHRLVAVRAHVQAEEVIPVFTGSGGWRVHGKTGSGWLTDAAGEADRSRPMGWFVGWAGKGSKRVVFARLQAGAGMPLDKGAGLTVREEMLAAIGGLAG